MKTLAKIIRVITIAPVMAICLILLLLVNTNNTFNNVCDLLMSIIFIVFIPTTSYILQKKFSVFSGDMRTGERKLAIVFSFFAYTILLIYALLSDTLELYKIMVLTYFLSGTMIFLFTFIFKINASGHMCGVSGPVALLFYVFGTWWGFLFLLLIAVAWSSIYLKRHSFKELIIGTIIPVISLIISVLII